MAVVPPLPTRSDLAVPTAWAKSPGSLFKIPRLRRAILPTLRIEHPRVLGSSALTRIDHERPVLERDPRQPARHNAGPVTPGEHERAQVDMARGDAFLDAGGAGREREGWLGDEVFRVSLELGAERLDRRPVGLRADHHSVTAGAVDLLDDELFE